MMTFADKLANALKAAKTSAGAAWNHDAWLATVNAFADAERPVDPKTGKARRPKNATPISKMTDDEFLSYLLAEPALAGIDVRREVGKCRFYWNNRNGTVPSRMRVVNWLNKADKTLTIHGRDADTRRADAQERSLPPPHGWEEFMKGKQREWSEANPNDGGEPPGTYALSKRDFFGMPASWRAECRAQLGGDGRAEA